jgi:hypothetical protein
MPPLDCSGVGVVDETASAVPPLHLAGLAKHIPYVVKGYVRAFRGGIS